MLRYDCWDLTTVMLCYDWFHFLFVTNQRAMVKFYVYGTLLCFVALCLVCIAVCCAIPWRYVHLLFWRARCDLACCHDVTLHNGNISYSLSEAQKDAQLSERSFPQPSIKQTIWRVRNPTGPFTTFATTANADDNSQHIPAIFEAFLTCASLLQKIDGDRFFFCPCRKPWKCVVEWRS